MKRPSPAGRRETIKTILKRPSACASSFARSRGKQRHSCSCCGAEDHRIERCPFPGAKEILSFRKLCPKSVRHGPLKHKPKIFPNPSRRHMDAARSAYSIAPHRPRLRDSQIRNASGSVLDTTCVPAEAAFEELVKLGFLKKPKNGCLHCGGKVSGPSTYTYIGKLYYRCTSYSCHARLNVCDYSVFKGTRLGVSDLLRVITHYCRSNRSKAPLVTDAMAHLSLPRKAVENIHGTLRSVEAKAGAVVCRRAKLKGNLEGDAHAIRKVYVSAKNEHFKIEIAEALKRWKGHKKNKDKTPPKYWQGSLRLCGIKQRDGAVVIAVLPIKLTPPGAAPPPESTDEILESKLLTRVDDKGFAILFSDGAKGWPKAIKQSGRRNIKNYAVSHKKFQFTAKLRKKPIGGSRTAGTQCIDRWWESLDSFIPSQLHAKRKGGGINEAITDYCFAFAWRSHLRADADMRASLGKIC